jgi:hypothetical protein
VASEGGVTDIRHDFEAAAVLSSEGTRVFLQTKRESEESISVRHTHPALCCIHTTEMHVKAKCASVHSIGLVP